MWGQGNTTIAINQIVGNITPRFTLKYFAYIIQKTERRHGLSLLPVQLQVNLLDSVSAP